MTKKTFANKLWLVLFLSLLLIISSKETFAASRSRSTSSRHEVVVVGHKKYHYHDGRFYRRGFFSLGFFLVRPPIGAIVTVLPVRHKTMIFRDSTYYYYDGVYYRACSSGYTVVPAPVIRPNVVVVPGVTPSQNLCAEKVTINIPNTKGGYTQVTLVRHADGYIGPQGEYYPVHPSVEQLKVLYGN